MAGAALVEPEYFVEKLIQDTEKTTIQPVNDYLNKYRGKVVELKNLFPEVEKEYLVPIRTCLNKIRQNFAYYRSGNDAIDNAIVPSVEEVHKLLHNTAISNLGKLGNNDCPSLLQEIPGYILKNPNSGKNPDTFVKEIIDGKVSAVMKKNPNVNEFIQEFRRSFENESSSCKKKSKIGSNNEGKISVGAAGATAIAATVMFGPVGLLAGAAIGAAAGKAGADKVDKAGENWLKDMLDETIRCLRDPNLSTGQMTSKFKEMSLDKYYQEIKTDVLEWIKMVEEKLTTAAEVKMNASSIDLHIDLIGLQFNQLWCLSKAILTQKPKALQDHAISYEKLKTATEKLPRKAQVVFTTGYVIANKCTEISFTGSKNDFDNNTGLTTCDVKENGLWKTGRISHRENYTDIVNRVLRNYSKLHANTAIRGVFLGDFTLKNLNSKVLNTEFNKFYGSPGENGMKGFVPTYWEGAIDDGYKRGGKPYYCPIGWHRIGLNIARDREQFDAKYSNWPIAYHGTNDELALDILSSGLKTGTGMFVGRDDKVVYVSPSVEYCGHPRYADVFKTPDGKYGQMVFQVRVNPTLISQVQPATVGDRSKKAVDPNFNNNEVTWIIKTPEEQGFVRMRDGLVIYGIMVRITTEHPENLPKISHWW